MVLGGLLERDGTVHVPRSPVRAAHRRTDGREVFFLINDSGRPWQGEVSLSALGPGELWEPASAIVVRTNLGGRVSLNLQPYGAALLRYPAARVPQKRAPRSGALPNLTQRAIPDVKPTTSQGEFVKAEVSPDANHSQPSHPAWSVSVRLTKGQVGTFMFVRLLYPEPLDLAGTECLVLDAWIPAGQQTGPRLLVIVQEKDGGDFLADTDCPLAAPGGLSKRRAQDLPVLRLWRAAVPAGPPLQRWHAYVGHYHNENPWVGSTRIVVLKGRLMMDGTIPLEADGDLFRLRDRPFNAEWIRFGDVVAGKCMLIRLAGGDLWRVAAT